MDAQDDDTSSSKVVEHSARRSNAKHLGGGATWSSFGSQALAMLGNLQGNMQYKAWENECQNSKKFDAKPIYLYLPKGERRDTWF